jgi:hypothetical protein
MVEGSATLAMTHKSNERFATIRGAILKDQAWQVSRATCGIPL